MILLLPTLKKILNNKCQTWGLMVKLDSLAKMREGIVVYSTESNFLFNFMFILVMGQELLIKITLLPVTMSLREALHSLALTKIKTTCKAKYRASLTSTIKHLNLSKDISQDILLMMTLMSQQLGLLFQTFQGWQLTMDQLI